MADLRHTHTESSAGLMIGLLLVVALLLLVLAPGAILFFGDVFRPADGSVQPRGKDTSTRINPPSSASKVDVQLNPPVQQALSQP